MKNISLKKIGHQATPNHMERFLASNFNWKITQSNSFKTLSSSAPNLPKQNEPRKISGSLQNNFK